MATAEQGSGVRELCRSARYIVHHSYEEVFLRGGEVPASDVLIGDFFGDPIAACIDEHERWCVTIGCGLIVYHLRPPWQHYSYLPTSTVDAFNTREHGPDSIVTVDGTVDSPWCSYLTDTRQWWEYGRGPGRLTQWVAHPTVWFEAVTWLDGDVFEVRDEHGTAYIVRADDRSVTARAER